MFKRVLGFFSKRCIGGVRMYQPGFAVYITLALYICASSLKSIIAMFQTTNFSLSFVE